MRVLLPPPEAPTRAVVVPAGTWMLMFLSTGTPGLYSNQTPSKVTSPRMSPTGVRDGVFRVLGGELADFPDPVEPREGLA